MNTNQWFEENAEQVPCPMSSDGGKIWVTKFRGDYITRVGMENAHSFLADYNLTRVSSTSEAGKPVCIGFNEDEQKWYGWSHRALFGFGIGSTCKKGDCHYRPVDKDDFLDEMVRFWSDDDNLKVTGEHWENGVYVEWEVSQSVANESMRGKITGRHNPYPDEYGRGEWTAKTLAEARQMAIDFASGVA